VGSFQSLCRVETQFSVTLFKKVEVQAFLSITFSFHYLDQHSKAMLSVHTVHGVYVTINVNKVGTTQNYQ
jgi:hypothetical protein